MTKKKATDDTPPLEGDALKQAIKKFLPGTSCRLIYDKLKPDMTRDRFSFVFLEAAAEVTDDELS